MALLPFSSRGKTKLQQYNQLLENPFFDNDVVDTEPAKWQFFNAPTPTPVHGVTDGESYSSPRSITIASADETPIDCGYRQMVDTGIASAITLLPHTTYVFSCKIKTDLTAGQAHVHIKTFDTGYTNEVGYDTPLMTGVNDWQENMIEFTTGTQTIAEVWATFGGWGSTAAGQVWWDDFALTQKHIPNTQEAWMERSDDDDRFYYKTKDGIIVSFALS